MLPLEKDLKLKFKEPKEYFIRKMNQREFIAAAALRFDSTQGIINCKLSDRVDAILPISEVVSGELKSLYNDSSPTIFYPEVADIIGKNIGVMITSYSNESSKFILSRRDSLINAFNQLKNETYIYCDIKSMNDTNLFLDCGLGVIGTVYIKDASNCKIRKMGDSFKNGDIIKCKIIGYDEETKRLQLSRKLAIEEENITLNENDIVYGKVRETFSDINDSGGQKSYFFEILPYNLVGILNTFYFNGNIQYNDTLVCTVTRVNPDNRYKLKILKRL